MRKGRYIIIASIVGIIVAGALGGWLLSRAPAGVETQIVDRELEFTSRIRFFGQQLDLAVADTPLERQQGLSGIAELPWGKGMVFVFSEPGTHGFWMKDMQFPIDIIWLDTEGVVVHVEEAVEPDTYPMVFKSEQDAQYVLEVPAGYVRAVCSLECIGGQVDISGQWQAAQ